MRKVLVTGGAGFIGSHLTDALVERGEKVVVFDSLDPQVHPEGRLPEYFNLRATFVRGDVRDRAAFKEVLTDADVVFHLAAAVGVGQSQYEIARYVEANIQGTAVLLDILANEKHRVRKLVVASSMSIYGEGLYRCDACGDVKPHLRTFDVSDDAQITSWDPPCPRCGKTVRPIPTPETTPLVSNSIYAVTKKEQEEMSLLIGRTYGIPVVSLRFFNVYGPRQSLSNPYTGVCAIFLSRLKNDRPPVVYEDGQQTRDFIWVGDIARACIACMENGRADYHIFNLGSGNPVAIREIAHVLSSLLGKCIQPEITLRFRKGDVRHCYADTASIRERIGFSPQTGLEEGLRQLIGWALSAAARDSFEDAERQMRQRGLLR